MRAAVREADQQPRLGRCAGELGELAGIVDDEGADAGPERVGDLGALLDRVRVDHPVRGDALEAQEGQLGIRCDVEAAALLGERADDLAMRERLDRVVEAHGRERGLQAAELPAHAVGVEQQQRRAVHRERGTGLIRRQQRGGLRATAVDERRAPA